MTKNNDVRSLMVRGVGASGLMHQELVAPAPTQPAHVSLED
jgi:hypothetical protein